MNKVFTNGCFDILHAGHIRYLKAAKQLGDYLIVGINGDASVKRLNKGLDRPIIPQDERKEIVSAINGVNLVLIFEEDTPYELIKSIKPDVLVKGGDWNKDDIVGSDIVKGYGGCVEVIPYEEGLSTTNIIERIRRG